jgi:nucleoid DNA-binding protein
MAKAAASAGKKAPTKSEIMNSIAERTGHSKKEVAAFFEALTEEIKKALGNKGAGVFTVPGLMKITKKKVAARPAQKGVMNPLTGQLYDRPAKPAYNKVTVRALKPLKEFVK